MLNQLGIEDSPSAEEFLRHYYENLDWVAEEALTVLTTLELIIWRRQSQFSLFVIKPFHAENFFKFWLDNKLEKKVLPPQFRSMIGKEKFLSRQFGLGVAYLRSLCWSSEYGYRTSVNKKIKTLEQIRGSFFSYAHRKQMLGRKINFRRKVKKKGLEEY